jgi:outer membrane protein OmpA-like peptidoglycan-associated protein
MRENQIMTSKNRNTHKWACLPIVLSSAAVLSSQLMAGENQEMQYQEAQQVGSLSHQYVGGRTRVGASITDDGDASADISHVFSETQNSSTSGGLWAGFDLEGDDKGVDAGGVQVNHNWVSRDAQGNATHVNKAFAAYDRNVDDHAKVTVGYGQEREAGSWEGHISKGVSDKRLVSYDSSTGKAVYEKAFDYGVGGSVGKFLPGSNARVRAGLDYQWGTERADDEDRAMMTTVSAGIEKFFAGTPHSIGLDVSASRKQGGEEYVDSDDTDTSASLSYHYDFGGSNIYQPDQRYRRVRVEIPGQPTPPTYAKKPVYKQQPIYKSQPVYKQQPIYKKEPVYVNKTVTTGAIHATKSTVELEGQTFFKHNSAVLIPSAKQRLLQIAAEIRKHGYKGNIRITGNSCGLGDPRRDQELSEERAAAVRNFMISQGFNPSHLIARGLGKGHPKYPTTADQDFKNRRVDIEYVTERQTGGTAGRTSTQRVQNGYRNVIAGYKRIQTGTKNVQVGVRNVQTGTTDIMVSAGAPGTPRVIWRTEAIATTPAWITRGLRNNIQHNRNVDTYRTTAGSTTVIDTGNNGPVAVDDAQKIYQNDSVTLDVLANDIDADNDTLTIVSVSATSQGGTVTNSGTSLVYHAPTDYVGQDTFTYTVSDGSQTSQATVTITISAVTGGSNQDPTAGNDFASVKSGRSVSVAVMENDSDPDGDSISVSGFGQGSNGTVTEASTGVLMYTPNAGFTGKDSFTYTIVDGNGGSATATVSVDVSGDTSLVCTMICIGAKADDFFETIKGPIELDVLANDLGKGLIITAVDNGSKGTTQIVGNKIIYTPGDKFDGSDMFYYAIEDETGMTDSALVMVYADK